MRNLNELVKRGTIKKVIFRNTSKRVKKKIPLKDKKLNPRSTYWKNKAKSAWGEYFHTKYDRCAVCGQTWGKLDAHHLITKGSNTSLRYDPNNGMLLCVHHHQWDKKMSAHGTPAKFNEYLQEKHPLIWNWMEENRFKSEKVDFKEAYERLTKLMEEL